MKILSLETSERLGSMACHIADGERLQCLAEFQTPEKSRSAQTLIPTLQEMLKKVAWEPREVGLLAITQGPGSFTGLRIGITAAKVFAYATGCQLIGVTTLEVIAEEANRNLKEIPKRICPAIYAEREQVFVADYAVSNDRILSQIGEIRTEEFEAWIQSRVPGDVITGPALLRKVEFDAILPQGVTVAHQSHWSPSARTVAEIGWRRFNQGECLDAWELVPAYHRASAAEEKRQQK